MSAVGPDAEEFAAALDARRELGPEYEDLIAASLADRVEKEITARIDARLAERQGPPPDPRRSAGGDSDQRLVAMASLVAGIPITGIVGGTSHGSAAAIGITWLGIALVNVAHAMAHRRR